MSWLSFPLLLLFCSLAAVAQTLEVSNAADEDQLFISDFIEGLAEDVDGDDDGEELHQEESYSGLSLSKDWALQFDKDLGRMDYMTADKQMEIHNNLLKVAELLHIIPEGSAGRFSKLILEESMAHESNALETTEATGRLDSGPSVSTLRRHGVTTFMNFKDHHYHPYRKFKPNKVEVPVEIETLSPRKFSPRLAMYFKEPSSQVPSTHNTVKDSAIPNDNNVQGYV